jgi:hypothetical protein
VLLPESLCADGAGVGEGVGEVLRLNMIQGVVLITVNFILQL